jgi:branched-chain amino acid transport system substrate-binding protein
VAQTVYCVAIVAGVAGKYKVVPVNADSQSKADAAINEVERLINQEKVDIIDGVYSSAHAVPLAAKVEQQQKILWITTAVATAVFKDKNLKYVFRAQIHSDQYGQAFAGFITENAKAKLGVEPTAVKVALIHEDGPYGVGVAAADEEYSKKAGLNIVMREGYSSAAPDLSTLVTKLKRSAPDVISHAGYNPDITLFLRQARESGLRFKMLIGAGAGYSQLDKLRATFGKDIDNFCNIDPVPAQLLDPKKLAPGIGELTNIMVERYKAKANATDVPPQCSMGFNQTWILLNSVLPIAKEKYAGEALDMVGLPSDVTAQTGGLGAAALKKLELARALATKPRLLLADESLGGLDSTEMERAAELLNNIRTRMGITIVWVEHIMGVLMRIVDRVIVLDHGEKIFEGPPAQAVFDPRVTEVYLGKKKT